MSGPCVRIAGLTLAVILVVAASAPAQDFFEQKRRELAIQAQQTAADVTAVLDKSRKLEKTDASQAKALLNKSLLTVNDSVALDDKQRAELRGKLLSRLKEVEASVREQASDTSGKSAADKSARAEKEQQALSKLQAQQKSVYDQAKQTIESGRKSLDDQQQLRAAREKGFSDIAMSVNKSAAGTKEQRITEYFIQKSEKRKTSNLSKEEVALLKALNSTISVNWDKQNLKDVMNELADKTGINIFPDAGSLKDAGVEDYDAKISFKANKVTVRTVLKKVLADVGLTYVIKEGNLAVITPDRAKDYLVTRIYPVQDLIAPFDMRWGPMANQYQMMQQANMLIQMIVTTVEPSTWVGMGDRGYGTISFDFATNSLVVRHTAEMHYMLGGGFGR
jgi:hypothetical protein